MDNLAVDGSSQKEKDGSAAKIANQIRFETELEFVQCLANPHYLASLATQGLLSQPNFIAYLKYLTYWLDVENGFGRFVVYPHALHHLALLQQPSFREALKDPELRMRLEREQYLHWRTWRTSEVAAVPHRQDTQATVDDGEPSTPNPTRPTRRSGTARSSGARTPAGRTPRSVRTPGPPGNVRTPGTTVRTPGITIRTPAPKSALSVSVTVNEEKKGEGTFINPTTAVSETLAQGGQQDGTDRQETAMLESPEDGRSGGVVAASSSGDLESVRHTEASIGDSKEVEVKMETEQA
ncbi:suppressor of hpr1 [Serendipita sp. 400]|nr:suppressor of hpr1 [Serendipita sp. 400]